MVGDHDTRRVHQDVLLTSDEPPIRRPRRAALMSDRIVRREVRGCLGGVSVLAGVTGYVALSVIFTEGVGPYLEKNPLWFGLLVLGCVGYAVVLIVRDFVSAHIESPRRYAELYAATSRLKDAGQALQDAMARGNHDEVISAELHWHRAVVEIEAVQPPSR
jgi:hypothetical protein